MKAKLVAVLLMFSAIACTKKQITPTRAFSPNGDGINDNWRFTEAENDPDAEIKVFSKDGLLIYQCNGSNPIWDGKYGNGIATSGMYYYTIKTKHSKYLISGSLMLI
jgi:gliding motility-associated-like protein